MNPACEGCGRRAVVHFVCGSRGGDPALPGDFRHWCEQCGKSFVRTIRPVELSSYCADLRPGDTQTLQSRTFRVVGENVPNGSLRITEKLGGIATSREWSVPRSLVPEEERHVGGQFSFDGNPLELEIFTEWFR